MPIQKKVSSAPEDGEEKKRKKPETKVKRNPCPEGLVFAAGKCADPTEVSSHLCEDKDFEDCERQCASGDADSCFNLGLLLRRDMKNRDLVRAEEVQNKACDGGNTTACVEVGELACRHRGQTDGTCRDPELSRRRFKQACEDGDASGCLGLAFQGDDIGVERRQQIQYLERSCKLGSSFACGSYGFLLIGGFAARGVELKRQPEKGLEVLERSCEGEGTDNCLALAMLLKTAKKVKPDAKRQLRALEIACNRNHVRACGLAGELLMDGAKNVARDGVRAQAFFRKGCPDEGYVYAEGCVKLARYLWNAGKPTNEVLSLFTKACRGFSRTEACTQAARVAAAMVIHKLQAQCEGGDGVACEELSVRLLIRGCRVREKNACDTLEEKHPQRALDYWERDCAQTRFAKGRSCDRFEALGGVLPARALKLRKERAKSAAEAKARLRREQAKQRREQARQRREQAKLRPKKAQPKPPVKEAPPPAK